MDGGHVRNT